MSKRGFSWSVEHAVIIRGFRCAPAELSRRIRLRPTKEFVAGQPVRPGARRLALVSMWVRESREWTGSTDAVNAGRHWRGLIRLVNEVWAHRKAIASIVPPGEVWFKSVLFTDSPNVSMTLPLALARKTVALDAEWTLSVWNPGGLAEAMNRDL